MFKKIKSAYAKIRQMDFFWGEHNPTLSNLIGGTLFSLLLYAVMFLIVLIFS